MLIYHLGAVMQTFRPRAAILLVSMLATALLTATARAGEPPLRERELLGGVAWVQQAPEARLATLGIFRNATAALRAAIDTPGSAADEQRDQKTDGLPNAVIVDVDETMLDNSPFQAWMVARGQSFDDSHWARWVAQRGAAAVPGALAFAKAAAEAKVDIFYVTNRACEPGVQPCSAKQDTMKNLAALGFPRATEPAAFLLKGEKKEWGSDKTSRRKAVAATHRIVMLVGDDMRDFLSRPDVEALHRRDRKIVERAEAETGKRWFVIPNPMYGSWLDRLGDLDGKYASLAATALPADERLTLATWNLEWLMTTAAYDELKPKCTADSPASNVRAFPCNKGRPQIPRREGKDFDAMADVARRIQADVVALQEVDGPAAAATVFRQGWQLACFSARLHPQKVGFAVREGIAFRCNPEFTELDVDGYSRAGADITLYPGTPRAVRLLAVHMKSGCFAGTLAEPTGNSACGVLRRQVPVLERWIDARVAEHARFAILGDFNRRLELDAAIDAGADEAKPEAVFRALSDNQPAGAVLVRATAGQPHLRCSPHDYFPPGAIDNILVSRSLAALGQLTYSRITYTATEAGKLPDHCPGILRIE
jgi:5'-nucleotidase (lipoprotein e(P4) family)